MTQITDAISFDNADVLYQLSGDAQPIDISGYANAVEISGFERQTGEAYTGDADTAVLTAGKLSPGEVTYRILYSEGTTDPTADIWDAFLAKTKCKLIWYPKGNTAGTFKWETTEGYITSCTPPAGDFARSDPILFEFKVKVARITRSVAV